MIRCRQCNQEYDEKIAAGICPFCGFEYRPEVAEEMASETDANVEDTETGGAQEDPRWLWPGTILNNRYRVVRVIGAGGFGITYQCFDVKTGIYKAIKEYFQQGVVNRIPGTTEVIVTARKRKEEFDYGKERLLNEAQIVARFQSSTIVKIDDYFEENNTSYMVMEYIESQTIEDYVVSQKRCMDPDEAIHIGVKICEALEEIHAAGIVHRDISPDNIFLDQEGNVKIIDFGSARLCKEDIDDRLIVLKPGFAPPEQYEKIDPKNDKQQAWTDVYALGALLYFVLTGQVPAESSDRKADFDTHTDRVCYPKQINPNIPEFLDNTIMTAMAINIHERFQNATELKKALLQERKVLPVEVVRKKKKFRRTAGIGTSLILVAALASYGVYHYEQKKTEVVLEPADISIWYMVSEDENLSQQKNQAMEAIAEELAQSDIYGEINIELQGIAEDEYEQKLSQANASGNMPVIYEATGVNQEETAYPAEDLKDVISDLDKSDYYFLSDYQDYFSEYRYLPTGFAVPVIYLNQSFLGEAEEEINIKQMSDYVSLWDGELAYTPISVKEGLYEDYCRMLQGFEDYQDLMAGNDLEAFLNGDTIAYFSDTLDYFTIRNALAGNVKMLPVQSDTVICSFSELYAISECDGNTEIAAKKILEYLISNFAQESYYIQTNLPGLPIEKVALTKYSTAVHRQFEEILQNMDDYTFEEY